MCGKIGIGRRGRCQIGTMGEGWLERRLYIGESIGEGGDCQNDFGELPIGG